MTPARRRFSPSKPRFALRKLGARNRSLLQLVRKRAALARQPQTRSPERLPTAMDEKKAIQKDKLRAAPLIKLNVGDHLERTNARGERTSRPRPFAARNITTPRLLEYSNRSL